MDPLLLKIHKKTKHPDVVPKGHLTTPQWMKRWDMSERNTQRTLKQGVSAGILTQVTYKVIDDAGRCFPVVHYFETPAVEKKK